jgi:hypothetical protein
MLNAKGRGRHSTAGRVYFWRLAALFVSATLLAVMRWAEDYHLFVFGALAFISAWLGRSAVRKALALLDADAYHGDGSLIYVDAGSLLRGQWAATATLESSSSFYVLAFTACCRVAFDYSRADEPSTPTVRRPCIVSRISEPFRQNGAINTRVRFISIDTEINLNFCPIFQ